MICIFYFAINNNTHYNSSSIPFEIPILRNAHLCTVHLQKVLIQANRDVTRMEIFMSLVHLLEEAIKGGGVSSSANAVENNTLTVHDSYAQAAPITATGRSGSLQ